MPLHQRHSTICSSCREVGDFHGVPGSFRSCIDLRRAWDCLRELPQIWLGPSVGEASLRLTGVLRSQGTIPTRARFGHPTRSRVPTKCELRYSTPNYLTMTLTKGFSSRHY